MPFCTDIDAPVGPRRSPCRWLLPAVLAVVALLCPAGSGEETPPAEWHGSIADAIAAAPVNESPMLLFFWNPSERWHRRMNAILREDSELQELLVHYTPVSLTMPQAKATADAYRIRALPALAVISFTGEVAAASEGFQDSAGCREFLLKSLGPLGTLLAAEHLEESLAKLAEGEPLSRERWCEVLAALGHPVLRQAVRRAILDLPEFPSRELAGLLSHPRLSVRLAATELLEEKAGDSFGYDPWRPAGATSRRALQQWSKWAEGRREDRDGKTVFAAVTPDELPELLRELSSNDWSKAARARGRLLRGGDGTVAAAAAYIRKHPELPGGTRALLREIQYAACLQKTPAVDGQRVARQLVLGDLDARLGAISELAEAGTDAVPVVLDLLREEDALVREAAADSLGEIGGPVAVAVLAEHLETEDDVDVTVTIATRLGKITTLRSMQTLEKLLPSPAEDVRFAALEALAKFGSNLRASDALLECLEDESWRIRAAAVTCLAAARKETFIGRILERIDDRDAFVRASAIKGLSSMEFEGHAEALEKAYHSHPDIRPMVILLFATQDSLPESVRDLLPELPPDQMRTAMNLVSEKAEGSFYGMEMPPRAKRLQVVQNLLVDAALKSDSVELRAAAFASLGPMAKSDGGARARIIEALQSPHRIVRLETLRALRVKLIPELFAKSAGILDGVGAAPETADGAAAGSPEVDELADLFGFGGGEPEAQKDPATGKKREEPPTETTGNQVDDLVEAFGFGGAEPAEGDDGGPDEGAADRPAATEMELYEAVLADYGRTEDPEEKTLCSLKLALLGDPVGLNDLADGLGFVPEGQTAELMEGLLGMQAMPGADDLVRAILDPAHENVAEQFAERILQAGKPERWLEWTVKELTNPGGALAVERLSPWTMQEMVSNEQTMRALRPYAMQMAAPEHGPPLRAFALLLLAGSPPDDHAGLVEAVLKEESATLRAGGWMLLAAADAADFAGRMEEMCADTSPVVRRLLPGMFVSDRLDIGEKGVFRLFVPRALLNQVGRRLRLAHQKETVEAIRPLVRDRDSGVVVLSTLALAVLREPVNTDRLAEALSTMKDPENFLGYAISWNLNRTLKDRHPDVIKVLGSVVPDFRQESDFDRPFGFGGATDGRERAAELPPGLDEIAGVYRFGDVSADPGTNKDTAAQLGDAAADPEDGPGGPEPEPVELIVFYEPGCPDCQRLRRAITQMVDGGRHLRIRYYDITESEGLRRNEALCRRFGVSERDRLVAPAVFAAAGGLVRDRIDPSSLEALIAASKLMGPEAPELEPDAAELASVGKDIHRRFDRLTLGVVIVNGLADGINPCAFAAMVFLLSYLGVTRRRALGALAVGCTYTLGVFLAYLAMGLGLEGIASRLQGHELGAAVVKWVLVCALSVLFVLSLRDAFASWHKGADSMVLRLPHFLGRWVRARIRSGIRSRYLLPAAFFTGTVVALLEFACTGQVYLPTILFVVRNSGPDATALGWLGLYNLAFVLPLAGIFLLYAAGLRSDTLTRWFDRHATASKLLLAAVFLAMLLLVLGGK